MEDVDCVPGRSVRLSLHVISMNLIWRVKQGRRIVRLDARPGDLRRAVGPELLDDMRADTKRPAPPVTTTRWLRQDRCCWRARKTGVEGSALAS